MKRLIALLLVFILSIGAATPALADCCDSVFGCAVAYVTDGLSCVVEELIATVKTLVTMMGDLSSRVNAHDAVKATAYDAPNIISMECGSPSTIGVGADREGFRLGFAHGADWKVSLINEAVDVASSGDLAVYRGTYNEDSSSANVPMTHKTNFISEFKRQSDGQWKIVWYSVSNMERSHPK